MPLPLVDPHHHLWDVDLYPYPWLANSPIAHHYGVEDLQADATGAHWPLLGSVHVQGEVDRRHALDETAWLQGIADRHGFPHGIVAYAPLHDPDVDALLDAHARHPNLRGIRQILNPDQSDRADFLTDPAWQAGYARLARHRLSFDLQALPSQFDAAADLAARQPDVPVIVNHTGMPRDRGPEGLEHWRRGLRRLAAVPHVSVKISGFAMWEPNWTVDSIRPLVLETIDIFGVERCMVASNFPVDRLHKTFGEVFGAFETITAPFSEAERRALFHDNAVRVYRLRVDAGAA